MDKFKVIWNKGEKWDLTLGQPNYPWTKNVMIMLGVLYGGWKVVGHLVFFGEAVVFVVNIKVKLI